MLLLQSSLCSSLFQALEFIGIGTCCLQVYVQVHYICRLILAFYTYTILQGVNDDTPFIKR